MSRHDPRWRERYAAQLGTPEETVGIVEDGDTVYGGIWTSVPMLLCAALAERAGALRGVTVSTGLTTFKWDRPEILEHYRIRTVYAGPHDRQGAREGRIEYVPLAQWREGELPPGFADRLDVAMVPISPPDAEGYCSFGSAVWLGPTVCRHVRTLIGEVHPDFIRTGGENRIHVSRFARLTECMTAPPPPPVAPRSEETEVAAQVICVLVANEIVYDRCTLQIGIGDVSAALAMFLGERHDLGIHTELLPGGVTDLVEQGVVTGKYKAIHPGKVVAAAMAQVPRAELDYLDGNPVFEFYDFTHTDDLRHLLRLDNFVAVNNALAVDVTGNVASEGHGPAIFSGTGGQAAFAVAASTAAGGSVIVLPSSQLVGEERRSRIVVGHEPGTVVTVHRAFVDYVVTEQGIARLRGKSVRERIGELVSVAHPDFRGELRRDAARTYGIIA
jgi:4-hydroxybutyrate CoA-transferase